MQFGLIRSTRSYCKRASWFSRLKNKVYPHKHQWEITYQTDPYLLCTLNWAKIAGEQRNLRHPNHTVYLISSHADVIKDQLFLNNSLISLPYSKIKTTLRKIVFWHGQQYVNSILILKKSPPACLCAIEILGLLRAPQRRDSICSVWRKRIGLLKQQVCSRNKLP